MQYSIYFKQLFAQAFAQILEKPSCNQPKNIKTEQYKIENQKDKQAQLVAVSFFYFDNVTTQLVDLYCARGK